MKYILLIYEDEKQFANLTKEQGAAIFQEYGTFTDNIKKSGHLVVGEPLDPTPTAKTVRVRGGKTQSTDGPFAETREQLGGFYIIEAKNMDEGVGIAARVPSARVGSIEVRPIMKM